MRLLPEGKVVKLQVEGPVRAGSLLKMVGMNPESAVVLRKGAPVVESDHVKPGERVDVVRVLSGG